jgi:hypothetical protein
VATSLTDSGHHPRQLLEAGEAVELERVERLRRGLGCLEP